MSRLVKPKQIEPSIISNYVLTTSGGTVLWAPITSGSSFTGNTSGDCITDLWVSNIHSCSPLYINPNNEGNIYFGSANTITVDLVNDRLGIGGITPSHKLHVRGVGSTSATKSLSIENSSSTEKFYVRDDGAVNSTDGYWLGDNKFLHKGAPAVIFHNIGLGLFSLNSGSLTGAGNIGIGYASLQSIAGTSQGNIALGYNTAPGHASGSNNIVIGIQSGLNLNGGSNNVLVGAFGGANVSNTSNNTMIGYGTTFQGTNNYSFSIALGYGAQVKSSNVCVIGSDSGVISDVYIGRGQSQVVSNLANVNFQSTGVASGITDGHASASTLTIAGARGTGTGVGGSILFKVANPGSSGNAQNGLTEVARVHYNGNIGIGTVAPTDKLHIYDGLGTGAFRYQDGNEGAGKVLTSDANGVATWQTPSGGSSGTTKYATTVVITGGTAETITHNLGSTDIIVQIKDSTGAMVIPDTVDNYQTNSVDIKTSITDTYRVIIIG